MVLVWVVVLVAAIRGFSHLEVSVSPGFGVILQVSFGVLCGVSVVVSP